MGATSAIELGLIRLIHEAFNVPLWEYAVLVAISLTALLYYALDFHFVGDLITGLRGDKVQLVFSPLSKIAPELLNKCGVLNRRYRPTPWLCSPHLQTAFLHFHGRAPRVEYKRTLFVAPDGGTMALDWLEPDAGAAEDKPLEELPIVIVVPGLSSDSSNAYLKHLAHAIVSRGWRALITNHRGLGGVSLTSDEFYNAGWTNDIRGIIADVHTRFPAAPLFGIGTSLGANILVKYLGEEGDKAVLKGAVALCCPWDLVVCDRFISRRPVQQLYNKALAIGLTDYVLKHEKTLSKLSTWDFIKKARSVRSFDNFFTRLVGKFETVDDYYRRSSCVYVLNKVMIPLLGINSLDDPLCTKEAIPWDECRFNPNVILAVTRHGGHLAYYEGLTANKLWWVPAVTEFASAVLTSSSSLGEKVSTEKIAQELEETEMKQAQVESLVEEVTADQMLPMEKASTEEKETQASTASTEKGQLTIQLCLRSRSELVTLEKALGQLLQEPANSSPREETLAKPQEETVKQQQALTTGQILLLVAVPLIGSAVAIGLKRKGFFKRFL